VVLSSDVSVIDLDADFAYVPSLGAFRGEGTVSVIDLTRNTVTGTVAVGFAVNNIAIGFNPPAADPRTDGASV